MQDYSKGTVRLYFANEKKKTFKIRGFVNDSV